MFGKSNNNFGFTLIEILVAIALVGLLAAIVMPNFSRLLPNRSKKLFAADINQLTGLAWQQALVTNTVHRIEFDIPKRTITILQESKNKKNEFVSPKQSYTQTTAEWPEQIELKNFYVEGSDELATSRTRKASAVWFYVVPDGLTQQVIINAAYNSLAQVKPEQIGLVLNPFTAQFTVYDSYQK